MSRDIFKPRKNYKPFEYPEVLTFVEAIHQTFWTHTEIPMTADTQDYLTSISHKEREIVRKSMLSVANVEVCVKTFWGDLYKHFPKPEFNDLGATFASNETIHSLSYSQLLTILGLEKDFEGLMEVPIFQEKFELMESILGGDQDIIHKLLFFTIVIENASLFSQFANILALTHFKGLMKNIANVISYTSSDEDLHRRAGEYIINTLKEEGHVSKENLDTLRKEAAQYIKYEEKLLEWIYEEGEYDFFTKEDMLNFMKKRVDDSLKNIGIEPIYNITDEQYKPMLWYDEEVFSNALDDFFAKKPTEYTKHDKSITEDDLF